MELLLKDYFASKGCSSSPNFEDAKRNLRYQLKNTIQNFEQQCQEEKLLQQQNIPSPPCGAPQYPPFSFNPMFQQPFNNPMLNPMFRQQQLYRMLQPPIIQQQQQQHRPPPFTRPQRFQNRQRFNFRQRLPNPSPPSQNSFYFPPPRSL